MEVKLHSLLQRGGRLSIGTLLLFLFLSSWSSADEGDLDDEFAFLQEEDLVFSAAKHRQEVGFSPSAVVVITREEIEKSGAVTLMELLRCYPVVESYEFDPAYPTARIRGNYRVLMLLDGRELNLELFAAPWYGLLPVGLSDIERIEIVVGPNSALYGANAVSAVVNIVSRPARKTPSALLSMALGEKGNSLIEGVLGGGFGRLSAKLFLGVDQADSWMERDRNARDVKRANATLRLDLDGGQAVLNGGLVHGVGRLFTLVGYLDAREWIMAHLKTDLEIGDLKARAYWYAIRGDLGIELGLIYPDLGLELGSIPPFDMFGDTVHLEAQYDLEPFDDNLLIVGSDFRYTSYRCDQFIDPQLSEVRVGAFLHDEHEFSDLVLLTAGLRFDWNSRTDAALSPRVAAVVRPAREHYIRLSAGTAFRKPTLLETSTNFHVDTTFPEIKRLIEVEGISNPGLSNESLTAIELGYRGAWFDRALRLQTDVYLALNRNYIGFDTYVHMQVVAGMPQISVSESRLGYENLAEDTNIVGLYLGLECEPVSGLSLFLKTDMRYGWLVEKATEDAPYPIALRFPRVSLMAGGRVSTDNGLVLNLSLIYVSGFDDSLRDPVSVLAPAIERRLPRRLYALASLNYFLDLGGLKIDLGLSWFNPFGEGFREKTGVQAPDGSNFGGELMTSRAMFTARIQY